MDLRLVPKMAILDQLAVVAAEPMEGMQCDT